jgi:O-antigen ligase
MTGSRGGFLLTVFALGLAFFVRTKLAFANRQIAIVAVASTIVLGLAALELFGGTLNARFDTKGLSDVDRLEVYSDTLRLIADRPWLGSGLGTFPFIFPAYRDDQSNLWGTIDRAHDTPLELAAELGIPLTVVIATAWITILWVLLRNARTQDTKGLVSAAAACLAILGLSQSVIDFSMQIAGFGIPVFAIVGAGLAQAARLPESDEAALAEEPEQDILRADSAG